MMAIAFQNFLFLGILIIADAVPQGPSVNRWGTNLYGGYSANIPSGYIQVNWASDGRNAKSASLQPEEAAIINAIVTDQKGVGIDGSVGNVNVRPQFEIIPGQQITQSGGSTVQSSNPTTTDLKQNQVGAADVNISGKPQACLGLPSPGECRGAFPRFFYNSTLDQCDCFLYGGCGEEEGSWLTFEECSSTCKPGNTQEGPRCTLLPKQEIVTFTQPKPVVSPAPDTSHLSDAELLDSLFG